MNDHEQGASVAAEDLESPVARDLIQLLDETFETHHGIYLDAGTSFFQTLQAIDAATASRAVGPTSGTIAAKVAHVTFYLEVVERYLTTGNDERADWGEIWRTVSVVSPARWTELVGDLRSAFGRLRRMLVEGDAWADPATVGDAMAIAVHTAYHLGEIREALAAMGVDAAPS